jgi:hypothetical protein
LERNTTKSKPKKVKTMRLSGMPVNMKDFLEFNEKWKLTFDKVIEKHGQDMQKVHKILEKYDKLLRAKYKNVVDWEEIKSRKKWSEKLDEYGPILVAKEQGTGDLLYVIADQNFQ